MNTKYMYLLIGIVTGLAIAFGGHQVILEDKIPQFELPPAPEREDKFVVSDAKISKEPGQDPSINAYGAEVCLNNVPIKFKSYSDFSAKVKTYYCEDKPFEVVVNIYATESIKRPWGEIEQHNKQLFYCKLSSSDNFKVPKFVYPRSNPDHASFSDPDLLAELNCQFNLKRERLNSK